MTVRCRKQDVQLVQVSNAQFRDYFFLYFFVFLIAVCPSQASIQRNIPIYKAAVKNNLEVRIDQNNFLSPDV